MTAIVENFYHHVSEKSFHPYLDIVEYSQYAHGEENTEAKLCEARADYSYIHRSSDRPIK